jgi:RTX calcium-binding nonapeptide repeat (4 copies)
MASDRRTGCSITDNYSGNHYSGWGGAISAIDATVTIRNSQFSGNVGYYGGGAILLGGGSLTIDNSVIKGIGDDISGGEAYGGAMQISNATAVISKTTISNHDANYGGAIFTDESRITIVDSTIANNDGSYGSGAIGYGSLIIRNSTITGNIGEGGINAGRFDLELSNSIVAGNTRAGNPSDVYGTITFSNGHNVFGSDVGANPAGDRENIAASAIFGAIDPATGGGQLNANGIVPLRNSLDNPALSGADPLAVSATDQLGAARPLPAGSLPDIGSVEINQPLSTGATANNDVRTGNGSDNSLSGLGGNDHLKGLGGKDTLSGGASSDLLDGGTGNDTLNGGSGTDFALFGGSTAVVVDLSLANDTAKRGSETDKLISIEGAIGSSAADSFKGDTNANWFQGGLGKDTASGGSGRDRYDLNTVGESGVGATARDVITDFGHLVDDIDLMGIDADTTVASNQAFRWVGTAAFTGAPGELGFFTSGGNTIIHGSNDADAAGEFEIQLNGMKMLTVDDFYF